MQVATEERLASLTEAFSYDIPTALSVAVGNARALGAIEVTVSGRSLSPADLTARARVGGTGCELSQWISDSTMHCKTAAAEPDGTLRLHLTIASHDATATLTEAFSFDSAALRVFASSDSPTANRPHVLEQ